MPARGSSSQPQAESSRARARAAVVALVALGIAVATTVWILLTPAHALPAATVPHSGAAADTRLHEASGQPASPGATWVLWPTLLAGPQPVGLAFWDAEHGIAVDTDRVWTTGDGGATWASSKPRIGSLEFGGVRALAASGSHAWVALGATGRGEWLVGSADRGSTWRSLARGKVLSLSFVSATEGYAIRVLTEAPRSPPGGEQDGVFVTQDGGRTWSAVAQARPCGAWNPTSLSFVDAGHGWLYCEDDATYAAGSKAVLETGDGGRTWHWRAGSHPGGSPAAQPLTLPGPAGKLAMDADGSGFISTWTCGLGRTTDGARSWTQSAALPGAGCSGWVSAIVPGGPWYLVASETLARSVETDLLRSDDRGATWSVQTTMHVEPMPMPTD